MDARFLSEDGWNACNAGDYVDRRCYPNSYGRGVHIWGSQTLDGEPAVVAGFATFGRLQISEMFEFLRLLYSKDASSAWDFVLLQAQGNFFGPNGGQLPDFQGAVTNTLNNNMRLDPKASQVVPDGHYMWFKRNGTRVNRETPLKKEWILSSRVITAQGSLIPSGMTTPKRDETIRRERRKLDGRCRVTGKLAVDRGELRGNDWSALHCAHVFPLGWSAESKMQQMFSTEALRVIKKLSLHVKDSSVNTMLIDARAHAWFDDYRFGIWPVQEDGKWYGKLFRFEQSRCDIDGLWLLAAARPPKYAYPSLGQPETAEQRELRKTDEREREEDRTRCDLTQEPELRELLTVHFKTCLHWHVKGMGWAK
ncbi:hypothetical protein DFH06DRAFT_1479464 [Mycena polygramma]|nr:hypothetical protein DFH06DRAFT_1479464 [Mycena polygramma]